MTTVTETRRRYAAELEGDWAAFAKIAGFSVYKVLPEDREDFHQGLLLEMAKVKAEYEEKGKPLREAGLRIVARYEVLRYWEKRDHRLFKPNCRYCTIEQRHECTMRLPSDCPKGKGHRLVILDKPGENGNGDKLTKVNELIAHSTSIDPGPRLDAKLDARRILQRLPNGLVKIGYKIYAGIPLELKDLEYLSHWRKVHPSPFDWRQLCKRKTPQRKTRAQFSNLMRQQVYEINLYVRKLNLGEGILELLLMNPQGMTKGDLCIRLRVYVRELDWYLNRLIKKQQVIAVTRESTRGRPPTPLLLIAGATIPEEKNVATERDERIRQAYFIEGWSIKRINRELHHDKRTIRRAISGIKVKRR